MDPTGGSIANLTTDMLKRVALAAQKNPRAVTAAVRMIAEQLGTGTAPVVRGIAASMGSSIAATKGFAGTATTAVQAAISSGALVPTEAIVTGAAAGAGATGAGAGAAGTAGAAGAAGASSGGMFAWFTAMGVAAQVATVIGAVVLTSVVAQSVGSLSGDAPSAVGGDGPSTTLESGPGPSSFSDGFKAVGVQFDGEISIVSVRGTTALDEGIAPCRFRHGGVNCDDDADIVDLDPNVYDTSEEATEALCVLLDGPRFAPALSDGWKVPYAGSTVTLDDWGSVSFAVCDEMTAG